MGTVHLHSLQHEGPLHPASSLPSSRLLNAAAELTVQPVLKKIDFKRLNMASAEECNDLCNDNSDCEWWKYRDGHKRVKRTCSLYKEAFVKDKHFISGSANEC